jgi:hypothetical protein
MAFKAFAAIRLADGRLYATVDELKRMRDLAEKYHISVDALHPFPASSHIDRERRPSCWREPPAGDRDIEDLQTLIRNCAATGIPAIKYNLCIVGDLRTVDLRSAAMRRIAPGISKMHIPAARRAPAESMRMPTGGAHRVFSRSRDSCGRRIQDPHGAPPA